MLTAEAALEAARALYPRLAERAAHCEALRRCPPESIADFHRADLLRLMQPRRFGGSELGMDVIGPITLEMSRVCPSTAWVWVNIVTHAWNIGQFEAAAQQDLWGDDPDALAATGLAFPCGKAEPVDGGYRLSGRWPFCSGVDEAGWMLVGALVPAAGGPPERLLLLVPKADFRSLDNWRAYGLAGTGSHDVVIEAAFVPAHRTVAAERLADGQAAPGAALSTAPIFRLPAFVTFGFALAAVPLGAAWGALDHVVAVLRRRAATYGAGRLAELAPVQARIAHASAGVDTALMLYRQGLDTLNRMTAAAEPVPRELRLRWKRDLAFAVSLCVSAMDDLLAVSGAAGLSTEQPLQRLFRDVRAAASHIGLTWDVQALMYGREALGLPADNAILL